MKNMLRYKTKTRPGLVALYDIRPGNGAGPLLQPRSPHGAWRVRLDGGHRDGDRRRNTLLAGGWRRLKTKVYEVVSTQPLAIAHSHACKA